MTILPVSANPRVFPTLIPSRSAFAYLFLASFWTAVFAWCSLPLSPNAVDSDFWGHVQYGRDIVEFGLPRTSTYTYTAVGHPWINHEILSEVVFAFCVDYLGSGSLVFFKSVLGLMVLACMVYQNRRLGSGLFTTAAMVMIVAWSLSYYWSVRPQVASFLYFGAMLTLLGQVYPLAGIADRAIERTDREHSRQHGAWFLILIPLFCVWANSHGGFLAGLAVWLAFVVLRTLEAWVRREFDRRMTAWCVGVSLAAALITVVNPYGVELHLWLLDSLRQPRPEVVEWRPLPWSGPEAAPAFALIGVLAISAVGVWLDRRTRRIEWTHWGILALTLCQVLAHRRHIPFLALECGFWLPVPLTRFFYHVRGKLFATASEPRSDSEAWLWSREYSAMFLVAMSITSIAFAGQWIAQWRERIQEMRVTCREFPVTAFQFMADNSIQGKLFCTGRWGQYALATFGAREPGMPGITVGFDGRYDTCYPRSVVDMHFDFVLGAGTSAERYRGSDSPPLEPSRPLSFCRPDYVLLDRRERHACQVMEAHADEWVVIYQDALAQLWGRRGEVDNPANPRFVPESSRSIGEQIDHRWVTFPAAPLLRNLVAKSPSRREFPG